jgi:hypothetical protein
MIRPRFRDARRTAYVERGCFSNATVGMFFAGLRPCRSGAASRPISRH